MPTHSSLTFLTLWTYSLRIVRYILKTIFIDCARPVDSLNMTMFSGLRSQIHGHFGLSGYWLTFWIMVSCSTAMLLFGYDQGVFGEQ